MSFAGSVSTMITTLKNNSRPKKSKTLDNNHLKVDYEMSEKWKHLIEKKATSEQLEEIRANLAKENKKENMKIAIILLFVIFIIFITIYVGNFLFSKII